MRVWVVHAAKHYRESIETHIVGVYSSEHAAEEVRKYVQTLFGADGVTVHYFSSPLIVDEDIPCGGNDG